MAADKGLMVKNSILIYSFNRNLSKLFIKFLQKRECHLQALRLWLLQLEQKQQR